MPLTRRSAFHVKCATTILVFCVAALLALGTVMLYSSTSGNKLLGSQLIWSALGIVACVMAASLDYRKLRPFTWILFAVTVILLIAVLVPSIGVKRNGAQRWLDLHFMNFQPSELAKVAVIFALAWYGERFHKRITNFRHGVLIPAALMVPVLVLVFLEPDYGTTVLIAAVAATMLIVAGVRLNWVVMVAVLGLGLMAFSVMHNENRLARVTAFLHPEEHRYGKGFQQFQATIALGSGGVTGVGLGDGRQKLGYVPENHTDFILSIVGEELGLIATMGVVLAFLAIVICGVYIATHACDRFGMLLGCGITFLIALQAFINIGVVTSALPNKGLPLPFVSYGGSNLLVLLTGIGLLLSVAREAREPARRSRSFNPFNPEEIPSTQLS